MGPSLYKKMIIMFWLCVARSQTLPPLTYIGQAIDSKSAFESILWFKIQDQTTASKSQGMSERQTGRPWLALACMKTATLL